MGSVRRASKQTIPSMERTILLVIIFSLHSNCLAETHVYDGNYLPPGDTCVDERELSYEFDKILVTKTERLPPITEIITLPPDMSHIPVSPVTETLTIFENLPQPPTTITVTIPPICQASLPVHTSLVTLELTTTLTADPIVSIVPIKEIELEEQADVTTKVTIINTIPKDINTHVVIRQIINTEFEPTLTIMETYPVTTTEMLSPIIKRVGHGRTKEERPPPVTERHAPITMMQPPSVVISRIDVTQTRIPPPVSKMVMATTTTIVKYPCPGYNNSSVAPSIAFTHGGRGATEAINFGLPNAS